MTAPNDPAAPKNTPEASASSEEARTRIIRRAPTGPMPAISASDATSQLPGRTTPFDTAKRADQIPSLPGALPVEPGPGTAVAACAVSIVSGWATSVVATELIAGWWRSDRLFCIAVGFLAVVFAIATVAGVTMLLLRRPVGRYLIVAGAVVAALTYGGVFIAGARVAWIVHLLALLPIASGVLAMHPRTKRWLE